MVVDDDPRYLELLEVTLESEGFDVRAVQDPRAAFETAAKESPDVLVTDVSMPELDGYELAVRLKADPRTVNIPLLFLSARGRPHERQEALDRGAVDYVTKPFNIDDLVTQIRRALDAAKPVNASE